MDDLVSLDEQAVPAARGRRRKVASVVGLGVLGVVLAGAVTTFTLALTAPDTVEAVVGNTRVAIGQLERTVTGHVVELRLGATGTAPTLDRCDGTFTHLTEYDGHTPAPVWAAHHRCGGDAILPLKVGDPVTVERAGDSLSYQVVEVRHTKKWNAHMRDLDGMAGDFIMQTCFYGVDTMDFVGLVPADTRTEATR